MIEEVEALMQHWAERCRHGLHAAGAASPLAVAMQYGMVPRGGGPGSSGLSGSVDLAAEEVDAALGVIAQQGKRSDAALAKAWKLAGQRGKPPFCLATQLVKLARVRYLTDPMPTVEQQMRRLKIDGKRTYHDRVQQLHERVKAELEARQRGRRAA